MVLAIPLAEPLVLSRFGARETTTAALMNTHPSYTLGARPETGRALRAWAVLSRGTFSGLIFLTDVALIVAMSCFTGVAYHLAAYGEPGSIPSFVQVGVLAASLFAVSNAFRGEYRLPNFFAFRPHGRRTIQLWNVTFVCLLVLGFLAQISVDYSRGWIVLFYIATFAALIVLRFAIVRVTAMARSAGLLSAQRIFLIGTGAHVGAFVHRYEPWTLGASIVGCRFLTPIVGIRLGTRSGATTLDRDLAEAVAERPQPRARRHLPADALVGDRDDRALRRDVPGAPGRNSSRARAEFCTSSRTVELSRLGRSRACSSRACRCRVLRSRRSGCSISSSRPAGLLALTPLLVLVAHPRSGSTARARCSSCSAATASTSSRSASSSSAPCARSTTAP